MPDDFEIEQLLGEGIHTAFRKASDHPAAWHIHKAIADLPAGEWSSIIAFVAAGIRPALLARLTEVKGERDEARLLFRASGKTVAGLEEDARLLGDKADALVAENTRLRDERDAAQFERDSLRGRVDALFAAQLEHSRVRQERDALAAENARLRQQVGEIGDALDREHAFEKAHIATIAQWRPVVEAAKALLAAFAGGTPRSVFRDAKRALESALQDGPSAPLVSPLSPSEPELVPLTTDGEGEQGETQGSAGASEPVGPKRRRFGDRFWLIYDGGPWVEVDKIEYVRLERQAGFNNTMGQPDEPATSAFGNGAVKGTMLDPYRDREQIPPSSLHSEGGSGRADVCGAEYTRPGGRQRGDRIVRCDRPNHVAWEAHLESETGVEWHEPDVAALYAESEATPADPPWLEEAIEAVARTLFNGENEAGVDFWGQGILTADAKRMWRVVAQRVVRAALPHITRGVRRDELQTAARTLLAEARAYAEKWAPKDEMWDRGYAAGMEAAAHTVANSIDRERAARAGGGE